MGRKLLLTLALAVLGAVIVASTGNADSGGLVPACSNGRDDDGDGLVDMADPGCSGPLDTSEYNRPRKPPACSNTQDDDGDGLVDMADPGCTGPRDTSEYNKPPPPPGGGGGDGDLGNIRVPKEFFGLAMGGPVDARDFREMHEIKVRTMRLGLHWTAIERRHGQYTWPDGRVALLAQNGIRPAFSVYGAPEWATGSTYQGVPPLKGYAKQSWKDFLREAVRHYGPRGSFWRENPSLKKRAVKSWQIWNEPNLAKYFARKGATSLQLPKRAPKAYAKLVKASDKAITKADKHAKVILAGVTAQSMFRKGKAKTRRRMAADEFLQGFFRVKGITEHFDAVGLHPYTPSIKKFKQAIKKTRKTMRRGGAGSKGVWLTEIGWGSGSPNRFHTNKGTRGQAKLLKKSFKLVATKRKKWNIGRMFWFDWRDPAPNSSTAASCSFCGSAGLLKVNRTPKLAYKKFKQFTQRQGKGRHRRHRGE